jgi:polysaccharide export outer membrane protein
VLKRLRRFPILFFNALSAAAGWRGIFWSMPLLLAACSAWEVVPPPTPDARQAFEIPNKSTKYSGSEVLEAFRAEVVTDYRLWDGDQIQVDIVGRPELSGPHTIGPDGKITLPISGVIMLRDLTREQAARAITQALARYYRDVYSTVRVEHYSSNRVIVLGRVEHPGVLQFESPPVLLEILSKAGGLPLLRPEQVLTRCAVIRGEKILWIDIKRLLTGDLSLNVQLMRNDTVYIPDATDTSVFVLGAVSKPGGFRLTPQMSVMDALSQAGGPTVDANLHELHLIRPVKRVNLEIDLESVLSPDPNLIVSMEENDILYVPHNGVAKIGYILQKINPFATLLSVKTLAAF